MSRASNFQAANAIHDFGETWDVSDVLALMDYKEQGLTNTQIAEHMGRTEAGVRSKWYRLNR